MQRIPQNIDGKTRHSPMMGELEELDYLEIVKSNHSYHSYSTIWEYCTDYLEYFGITTVKFFGLIPEGHGQVQCTLQ
jgi:hypothetical protein